MDLTHENYFSRNVMMKYMSTSQFKAFEDCEARAMAELSGSYLVDKDAYKEGHYFEACLNGNENLFKLENPDIVSSRGSTKGEVKSNFKKVTGSVYAFKRQNLFLDTIQKCKQQVIVTGKIADIDFKGMIDFFDTNSFSGYDTKCLANFKKVWSNTDKIYVNWYFAYGYHYQAAIYRELIRQQFGKAGQQYLLAVTKEDTPDVAGLYFSDEILDDALEIVKEFAPRYEKIKQGSIAPDACGECNYCKQHKVLAGYEVITEYE